MVRGRRQPALQRDPGSKKPKPEPIGKNIKVTRVDAMTENGKRTLNGHRSDMKSTKTDELERGECFSMTMLSLNGARDSKKDERGRNDRGRWTRWKREDAGRITRDDRETCTLRSHS